jgi:hypothetical protein
MARVDGKDLTVLDVDDSGGTARSVLAQTKSLDFKVSVETHDTTTLGDDWKEATAGLKGGDTFSHELMYDNAAAASGGTLDLFFNRLGVAGTLTIGDGVRTLACETIITEVSPPINVNSMIMIRATHQITGAVSYS